MVGVNDIIIGGAISCEHVFFTGNTPSTDGIDHDVIIVWILGHS